MEDWEERRRNENRAAGGEEGMTMLQVDVSGELRLLEPVMLHTALQVPKT